MEDEIHSNEKVELIHVEQPTLTTFPSNSLDSSVGSPTKEKAKFLNVYLKETRKEKFSRVSSVSSIVDEVELIDPSFRLEQGIFTKLGRIKAITKKLSKVNQKRLSSREVSPDHTKAADSDQTEAENGTGPAHLSPSKTPHTGETAAREGLTYQPTISSHGLNRPILVKERRDFIALKLKQEKESSRPKRFAGLKKKWKETQLFMSHFFSGIILWGGNIKSMEAHFGTTIASFFIFNRFLFLMSILPFLLITCFLILPQIIYNYTFNLNQTLIRRSMFSAKNDLLGIVSGDNWFERTELFYGSYRFDSNSNGTDFVLKYNIPVAYILTSLVIMITYLVIMTYQYGLEFKQSLGIHPTTSNLRFSSVAFGAWDFSITKVKSAEKYHNVIYRRFVSELKLHKSLVVLGRSWNGMLKIILIRIFFNVLSVVLLLTAAVIIFFSTIWALSERCNRASEVLGINIPGIINSSAIVVLNQGLQFIFYYFAIFEYYESKKTEVNITLVRSILIRLSSLIVLTITLFVSTQIPEEGFTLNLGSGSISLDESGLNSFIDSFVVSRDNQECDSADCWETYFGKEFYRLALTHIVFAIASELLFNMSRHFLYKYQHRLYTFLRVSALKKKFGHRIDTIFYVMTSAPRFRVAKNILDMIYFQALIFLGFFFCPFLPLFAFVVYPILFYVKLLSVKFFSKPSPTLSHDSSQNNLFYIILLIATYLACSFAVLFALLRFDPSPTDCGPFAGYPTFIHPITEFVENNRFLDTVAFFLGSAGFTYSAVYILILVIIALHFISRTYRKKILVYKTILAFMNRKEQLHAENMELVYKQVTELKSSQESLLKEFQLNPEK